MVADMQALGYVDGVTIHYAARFTPDPAQLFSSVFDTLDPRPDVPWPQCNIRSVSHGKDTTAAECRAILAPPRSCREIPRFTCPKYELLHLSRSRLWQIVDEGDPLRCLEVSQPVPHVKLELVFGRFGTLSQDNEGMGRFIPISHAACRQQRLPEPLGGAEDNLRPRRKRCSRRR
jgi:hypothetical protein